MGSVRDFGKPPYSGLPAEDVIGAIRTIQAMKEFQNQMIITVGARDDGRVMVRTGELRGPMSGGGLYAILDRNGGDWQIREWGNWAS